MSDTLLDGTIDYAKEYDNSGRVASADALVDAYINDAMAFRELPEVDAQYDLVYGPALRNRMDVFWPASEQGKARQSPLVMFIHGGYWQRLDRSSFSHLAKGLLANDIAVIMPSYTLCPDIKIAGIINEIRRACIVANHMFKRPLTAIGHSAGGHLAACAMATDWETIHPGLPADLIASGMGISGLYDLLPLLQTPINDSLGMDESSAKAASPLDWMPDGLHQFEAWVGGDESDEFHRQSRDLAQRWSMLGTPANYVSVDGANHFTVVDQLIDPQSPMVQRIVELVEKPAIDFTVPQPDESALAAYLQELEDTSGNPLAEPEKPKKKPARKRAPAKRVMVRKRAPAKPKTAKTSSSEKSSAPSKTEKPKSKTKPKKSDAKPNEKT